MSTESKGETARYGLETLALEWSKAGNRLSRTAAASCVVKRCRAMAFVGLRTKTGRRPVCLKHFELLNKVGALVA